MAEKIKLQIYESREVNIFIMQRLKDPKLGVKVKDRIYKGRIYSKCFIASEAIQWLVENTTAETKEDAISFGRHLQRCGVFHHVTKDHELKDEYLFFRFNKKFMDEIPPYSPDMKKFYLMDQIFGLGTIRIQSKSKSKRGSIIFRKKSPRQNITTQTQSMDFDLVKKTDSALSFSSKSNSTSTDPELISGVGAARNFERERARTTVSFRIETPPPTLAGIEDDVQREDESRAESKHDLDGMSMASSNSSLPPPSLVGSSPVSPIISPVNSPAPTPILTRGRARTASIASSSSYRDLPAFEDG
eukprot:TRINITY_DN3312_c0_g2_i1.p1 TRINITY_DN3312_c0_g2~~TRINITY_DN3312_c0_g2_i1.p1  ORF type:complete len:302 (+),score=49.77 TRINITY_DN3312_c0_g2_i1:112-1017(+)